KSGRLSRYANLPPATSASCLTSALYCATRSAALSAPVSRSSGQSVSFSSAGTVIVHSLRRVNTLLQRVGPVQQFLLADEAQPAAGKAKLDRRAHALLVLELPDDQPERRRVLLQQALEVVHRDLAAVLAIHRRQFQPLRL